MKKGRKILAAMMIMALAFAMAGCGKKDDDKNNQDSSSGASATAFENMKTTTLDGEKVNSKIFAKNKVTVVNVWSVTCPPCIRELPHLNKVSEKMKSKGVGVIGVVNETGRDTSDGPVNQAKDILKKAKAEYTQLKMSDDMLNSKEISTISYLPTTFIVDSKGKVLTQKVGATDEKGWEDEINKALKKV